MKNFIFAFGIVWVFTGSMALKAQDMPKSKALLIVIDGKISTQQALDSIPQERIRQMDYLKGEDARAIYGLAAAQGALQVKTSNGQNPVVMKDGQPVTEDSLAKLEFKRIDVIRGQQALNLYGPGAKEGVYLFHSAKEKEKRMDVLLEIMNAKGKPVNGAIIKDENEKILAISNKCGMAYVENLLEGQDISIFSQGYQRKDTTILENRVKLLLEKP